MNSPYFVEPFVDKGLGNSAYLIGSHDTKKGILIDPLRDVDQYLQAAEERGIQLTHVLDTHLHADFVSGNRETPARDSEVTNFFWPNHWAIDPEFHSQAGSGVWNKVLGVNRCW